MPRYFRQTGVTLFELMIAIVVASILLAMAIPSFQGLTDKNQVKGAAQRLMGELQYAHGEAISRSDDVTLDLRSDGGTDWCIGVVDSASSCDCGAADCLVDNQLHVVSGNDYGNVSVTSGDDAITFGGARGLPAAAVTFNLQSDRGKQIAVEVNPIGSVRICSPSGSQNLWEYPEC